MPLDRIITDPIISTENTTFSPSPSPLEHLPLASEVILPSERDPLVGAPKPKKPFYRARPLWYSSLFENSSPELTRVQASPVCIDRRPHSELNTPFQVPHLTRLICSAWNDAGVSRRGVHGTLMQTALHGL